jgi:hypothetical protein
MSNNSIPCSDIKNLLVTAKDVVPTEYQDKYNCGILGQCDTGSSFGQACSPSSISNTKYYSTILMILETVLSKYQKYFTKFKSSIGDAEDILTTCHSPICDKGTGNIPCSKVVDLFNQALTDLGYESYEGVIQQMLCLALQEVDISDLQSVIKPEVYSFLTEIAPIVKTCMCPKNINLQSTLNDVCNLITNPCPPINNIEKPYVNKQILFIALGFALGLVTIGIIAFTFIPKYHNKWRLGVSIFFWLLGVAVMILIFVNPLNIFFLDPSYTDDWTPIEGTYTATKNISIVGINLKITTTIDKNNIATITSYSCTGGPCSTINNIFNGCKKQFNKIQFNVITNQKEEFGYALGGNCIDYINNKYKGEDKLDGIWLTQQKDGNDIKVNIIFVATVFLNTLGNISLKLNIPMEKLS